MCTDGNITIIMVALGLIIAMLFKTNERLDLQREIITKNEKINVKLLDHLDHFAIKQDLTNERYRDVIDMTKNMVNRLNEVIGVLELRTANPEWNKARQTHNTWKLMRSAIQLMEEPRKSQLNSILMEGDHDSAVERMVNHLATQDIMTFRDMVDKMNEADRSKNPKYT